MSGEHSLPPLEFGAAGEPAAREVVVPSFSLGTASSNNSTAASGTPAPGAAEAIKKRFRVTYSLRESHLLKNDEFSFRHNTIPIRYDVGDASSAAEALELIKNNCPGDYDLKELPGSRYIGTAPMRQKLVVADAVSGNIDHAAQRYYSVEPYVESDPPQRDKREWRPSFVDMSRTSFITREQPKPAEFQISDSDKASMLWLLTQHYQLAKESKNAAPSTGGERS